MRKTSAILLSAFLLVGCAGNEEKITAERCLARVGELRVELNRGSGFDEVYSAYKAAREALENVEGDDEKKCEAAYNKIRADAEVALRRDNLSVMGWIMAFFAATVLWGGCATCVGIALKATRTIGNGPQMESAEPEEGGGA